MPARRANPGTNYFWQQQLYLLCILVETWELLEELSLQT